jgi:hypothetical protein
MDDKVLKTHERDRIITLDQASALTSLSRDTIKRNYRDKFIQLSPRRIGMRLGDVLALIKNA